VSLDRLDQVADTGIMSETVQRYREESMQLNEAIDTLKQIGKRENYMQQPKFAEIILRPWLTDCGYINLEDVVKRLSELGVDANSLFEHYGHQMPDAKPAQYDETALARVIRNSYRNYSGMRKLNKTDYIKVNPDSDGDLNIGNLITEFVRIRSEYDAWHEIKTLLRVGKLEISVIENPSPPMRKKLGLED
jgi:hypothetical protein